LIKTATIELSSENTTLKFPLGLKRPFFSSKLANSLVVPILARVFGLKIS